MRLALTPLLLVAAVAPALAQTTPASTAATPPDLATARANYERDPAPLDHIIWYGRRIAYTGAFDQAIAIYSEGLRRYPDEPHLLRHRGHRYLSVRQYDLALADLRRAYEVTRGTPDEVEPDGQPNARGIPTSTLQSNIRYHLALAHFLRREFPAAAALWREDAAAAKNLDQRVAATYWWVLSLARAGDRRGAQRALAPIRADWDIIENGSYHALLLWMKGDRTRAQLDASMSTPLERQTIGNGIAQWSFATGDRAAAVAALTPLLAAGPSASFGYLAAEALAADLGVTPNR
ncbi:MAG: hypothetical protein SFW08_04585 [Gemmatimonadaceae bacterium]|nr:hypothetical protein [Gemmatimonadaceae bacterium]